MSQSSVSGYVLRTPATAFAANGPVSSYRAWENRQNLLHLTDESAQHRINWVTPDAAGFGIEAATASGNAPIWSATYVHSWLAPGKPANLVLRVLGKNCIVIASVMPSTAPVVQYGQGNLSVDTVFTEVLNLSGTSPTEDNYLHINSAFDLPVYERAWIEVGSVVGSDGIAYRPRVCLLRLELQVIANDDDNDARVFGVMLRECA